jgi:sugar phosphate isomerase/epimerase
VTSDDVPAPGASGAGPPATELVLCAGCLPATPFRDLVAAASTAGFDAITLWPLVYRRAQSREGLDPAAMRALVDDAGLRVTELDAVTDWLPAPPDDGGGRPSWSRHEFFAAAEVMGADAVVAATVSPEPVAVDAAVEGFARLCADAAEHGLRVLLEFVAFSGIPDAGTAWRIVDDVGDPSAGLVVDLCHHVRSGGDDAALRRIPAERIVTVQLGDGPARPPSDLYDEARWHRADPGAGDFDLAARLAAMARDGVRARVGPELYRAGWSERDPAIVAADLYAATRRVLDEGRAAPIPRVRGSGGRR